MSRTANGRVVVQQVFGGALYQQGRGFYSSLELMAILRGQVLLEQAERKRGISDSERVLPARGAAVYLRPGHDHARRLLVSDSVIVDGVFQESQTRDAVRALLRGLEASVPGRRNVSDKWQLRHFYPYPSEAIHYDAVQRRGRISVERYQFRGAGGLAHKILRTDPNSDRLAQTRERFRVLLTDSRSAVGALLNALAAHDQVQAQGESNDDPSSDLRTVWFEDDVEARSLGADTSGSTSFEPTRWMQLLREGVHRLLHRPRLSDFNRIDGLMHWVPWCTAMHQLAMARRGLGRDEDSPLVFDAGHSASPVRAAARKDLGTATATIKGSLLRAADESGHPELTTGSQSWWQGPRSFFTTTMFAVGALNANTGRRHFELRPQLLQAIVHALVEEPRPLQKFSEEILGGRLSVVCNEESAARFGEIGVDRRYLKTNGKHLADRLDEVGLLRSYSDSTRMVGVHK